MVRITPVLRREEMEALIRKAQRERRNPREQAAHSIVSDLMRSGDLPSDRGPAPSPATQVAEQVESDIMGDAG